MEPNSKKPSQQELVSSALYFLKFRARSRAEIEAKLLQKTSAVADVAAVLDELTDMGMIDDKAFAQSFVQTKVVTKQQGPRRISIDLKRLGVDSSIISEALANLPAETYNQAALDYLKNHAWRLKKLVPNHQPLKAKQWLFSRGFAKATIDAAIDEFFIQE